MATTIKLKNSVTTTNAPSSLVQGEVAINITDKKVWVGNAATTPIQLLGAGASGTFGALTCTSLTNSGLTSGRVTYASTGGLLADSANFTFNGTTVTMANDASISGLTVGKGGGAVSNSTALGYQALNATQTNGGNVGLGYQSLFSTTSGYYNVGVGLSAGYSNTTGLSNTFVGGLDTSAFKSAGYTNTTGSNNTAVGAGSFGLNTTGSNNTAQGCQALASNTTASNNTAVGYQAGYSNQTGAEVTAIGYQAYYGGTGGANTALGAYALDASCTGTGNTALGRYSLTSNTTAEENTAVGGGALFTNTTGSYNTAVGGSALRLNTTASENTAVGYYALYANTTASYNSAFGVATLGSNTTGASNSGFGYKALNNCTTGNYNTAVGRSALQESTTASSNTAVGYEALYSNTTGAINTAIGHSALRNVTTSNDNTALGYYAGYYSTALTTGSQNVLLGAYTRTSAATSTYQFVIGYDVAGQADNNVTIGSASGKIYNAFTVNATWTQTSDGRLKKNIQEETLGLSFINRLRPVKYEWKASNELDKDNPYYSEENKRTTGVVMHGLIAQEVKEALNAEGVSTFAGWDEGEDGIQAISREMFITPLIKAIQELKAEVDSLKAQLNK